MNGIHLTDNETGRLLVLLGDAMEEFGEAQENCTLQEDVDSLQARLDETNALFELLYFRRQQANPLPPIEQGSLQL